MGLRSRLNLRNGRIGTGGGTGSGRGVGTDKVIDNRIEKGIGGCFTGRLFMDQSHRVNDC